VLEGPDLVAAALESPVEFEAIYVDGDQVESHTVAAVTARAAQRGVRVFALAPGVLARVADAATPQPVLAAVRLPLVELEGIPCEGLILVLHDVRDPGNAGTLIRSAEATGCSGVVFTGHAVDPVNPKTLRASAGAIFRVPVAVSTLEVTVASFRERGATVLATVVSGGESHRRVDFTRPTLVLIGNEADGLDDEALALSSGAITIEMVGASESLNAGVAGSLIAFEAFWRREGSATPP
jgi:RNA methyltransferase, TrmH family